MKGPKGVPKTARQWCLVLDLTEVGASVAEASAISDIAVPSIYAKIQRDSGFAAAFARARELAPPDLRRPSPKPRPKPEVVLGDEQLRQLARYIVEEQRRAGA